MIKTFQLALESVATPTNWKALFFVFSVEHLARSSQVFSEKMKDVYVQSHCRVCTPRRTTSSYLFNLQRKDKSATIHVVNYDSN